MMAMIASDVNEINDASAVLNATQPHREPLKSGPGS
jgi:hypothetical protein